MYKITLHSEKLESLLKEFPQAIRRNFRAAMQRSVTTLEAEAKENTPVGVSGGAGLRGSIGSEVRGVGVDIKGIVKSDLFFAPFVELGTKPHFPPVSALERWCELKLGDRKLAFVVARAISRRGTKARYMFKKAWEENKEKIRDYFRKALRNTVNELGRR